jgi:hypothetical protein
MKVTLYEALGISPTASQEEVRTALRALVRQYYVSTRQEQVEIEEALRFINHASHVLNDPVRRAQYDQEIATGIHINDNAARRDYVATMSALGVGRTVSRVMQHSKSLVAETDLTQLTPPVLTASTSSAISMSGTTGTAGEPLRSLPQEPQYFGLAASFAGMSTNLSGQLIFGVFLIPLLLVFLWVVTPAAGVVYQARLLLVWTTVFLLVAAGVYALVHLLAPKRKPVPVPASALSPALAQVTILKWRREKTVFLGTNEPLEDQTWLFRLRMAELERAKNHRTSAARPWLRLWARLVDYGLWGMILAAALRGMLALGWIEPGSVAILAHPLLAPTLITATWIPVEAALQVYLHTTPGKWLFAIYLQYGVSNVYASDDTRTRWRTCGRRALEVWLKGIALGLPVVSLAAMSLAKETLLKKHETSWDATEDCLVTTGEIGSVNAITGTLALMAFVWVYGNAWAEPLRSTTNQIDAVAARGGQWLDSAHHVLSNLGKRIDRDEVVLVAQETDTGPSPLDVKRKRWTEMSREADRLLGTGQNRDAVRLCSKWSSEDYNNARSWRCLGLAHEALGEHREAVDALQRSAKLDPKDQAVQDALVRSFRAQYKR